MDNLDIYIDLLSELIRMRPVTSDIAAVNRAQARLKQFLVKRGVFCTMESDDVGRDILFAATVPGKEQEIILCVHTDVVPATNESQYEPVIENGIMYARGAGDCLGNAVTAARILCNAPEGAKIGCIFAANEETGGSTTRCMVEKGYKASKLGLVLDGGQEICYGQKGILTLKLIAKGKGGHSSQPWAMDNPVIKLVNGLHALLEKWENPKNGTDDWRASMAVTVLSAGDAVNRIPDVAEACVNFRTVSLDEVDKIIAMVKETTQLEVEIKGCCDPFQSPTDSDVMRELVAAYTEEFGKPVLSRMCGATDARHLYKMGCPVYISGVRNGKAHSAGEFLDINSIDKIVSVVMKLI